MCDTMRIFSVQIKLKLFRSQIKKNWGKKWWGEREKSRIEKGLFMLMDTCAVRRRKCDYFNVFACLWHSRSSASCYRVKTPLGYYYPPQMPLGDLDLWCYTRNQIIWHDWEKARRRHDESNIKQQTNKLILSICYCVNVVFKSIASDGILCCTLNWLKIQQRPIRQWSRAQNTFGNVSASKVPFITYLFIFLPRFHVKFSCARHVNGEIYCLHFAHHRSSDVGCRRAQMCWRGVRERLNE